MPVMAMAISEIIMENTTDITPTSDLPPSARKRGRWAECWGAVVVSLFFGAGLLATGPVRFLSELFLLQAGATIQEAEGETLVPVDVLESAVRQAEAEAARHLSVAAGDWAGRGNILLALYRDPTTPEGQAALAAARAAFHDTLAAAPLAPYTWQRLAYVEYAAARFHEATAAWRMSARMGAFDPVLIPQRFYFGLALYPYMDHGTRELFAEQIRLYGRWRTHDLAELMKRTPVAVPVIRSALASDPMIASEVERILAILMQKS